MNLLFISPPGIGMPKSLLEELKTAGVRFSEHTEFQPADAYYVTRLQDEYAQANRAKLKELTAYYSVNKKIADKYGVKAVLHPFPRSEEYNELPAVDDDSLSLDLDDRNFYFQQMANGLPVRMALLKYLLRPSLELNQLREMQVDRSYNTQCLRCRRLWSPLLDWSRIPYPDLIPTYSGVPLCPICEKQKDSA